MLLGWFDIDGLNRQLALNEEEENYEFCRVIVKALERKRIELVVKTSQRKEFEKWLGKPIS